MHALQAEPGADLVGGMAGVVASRMRPALAPQTWSLLPSGGRLACHAFLLGSGTARLDLMDGADVDLEAPAMAWLPPRQGRGFRLAAGASGMVLSAPEEAVWRTIGDIAIDLRSMMREAALASGGQVPFGEILGGFEAILRETRTQAQGGPSIIRFNLSLILLHLWRAAGPRHAPPVGAGGTALSQRFRQLVELHFRDGLAIGDYAARLGVTRGRLHDACVRAEGTSPLTIIHARLLEEAKRRLAQTDLSVEQVAYSLGFRDAPYFNRFFTRLAGATPGAFRRRAAHQERPVEPPSFAAWP